MQIIEAVWTALLKERQAARDCVHFLVFHREIGVPM